MMSERFLGTLCYRGHDAGGGKSLRVKQTSGSVCVECQNLSYKKYRATPKGAAKSKAYKSTAAYREKERLAARRRRSDPTYLEAERARGRVYDSKRRNGPEWREEARKYHQAYWRRRVDTDERFALTKRLRARFAVAMKRVAMGRRYSASRDLGINWEAIIEHLGPCPGDRSDWHVDHIKPLASFDFSDPAQIREAFAPENHQWLRALENLQKGAR